MIRAPLFLSLLLAPLCARADNVAILEMRFASVPPALKSQIHRRMHQSLAAGGFQVTSERQTARRLRGASVPPGCSAGPCLNRIGEVLGVDRVVVGGVSSQGTSYDITMTMLETGGGTVLAQVSQRCDVCNFKEVEEATATAAEQLHKQALVFLTNRAKLVVESVPSHADALLDGLPAGKTPLIRVLLPGTHTVEIAAKGHTAATQKLTLKAGKTHHLRVSLLPKKAVARASPYRLRGPSAPRWVKWTVLGAGVVAAGIGGGLVALDGREMSDSRYVHDTRTAGVTMISLGAAAAVAATLITLAERLSSARE
jgi:hypothetical protein